MVISFIYRVLGADVEGLKFGSHSRGRSPINCGHCGRKDPEVDRAHVLECSQFRTIEDLERVLEACTGDAFLLDGVAIIPFEPKPILLRGICPTLPA